jgi:hypothetical protein
VVKSLNELRTIDGLALGNGTEKEVKISYAGFFHPKQIEIIVQFSFILFELHELKIRTQRFFAPSDSPHLAGFPYYSVS